MTDKEKLDLIKEALNDVSNGSLSGGAFVFVINDIVNGFGEITEECINWAKKVIIENIEMYGGCPDDNCTGE
jgi:hypothetical protein